MTFAGGSDHGFGTPEHKMFYHTIVLYISIYTIDHNRAQANMYYIAQDTGYSHAIH